jgi:hypothetical protein
MKKIPKIKLVPIAETSESQSALGYTWNTDAGFRHFLGGEPDTRVGVDVPKCQDCGFEMTFYSQIDSIGEAYDLADCMVIHTYVCFDCFTVNSMLNQI